MRRRDASVALAAMLCALRDLGWSEGDNLTIEYRRADGDTQRLPQLAAELVRSNVDVIVAPAAAAVLAAKSATRTIPIVMIFPADPVGLATARSLGLTVPRAVLERGHEVIT